VKKKIIYKEIKEKIISGKFAQGSHINEKDIIENYKVSRTPIREALNLLEIENWIKSVPRKGYVVTDITFSDIKDLFQIRYELEPVFLTMAFNYFEKDELENLKNEIEKLKKEKNYDALREIDTEFHLYLIKSTYNKFATKTMENINDHINRTRYLTFSDEKETTNSANDHIKIIEALMEKNLDKALDILRKHIDRSQLYFIRHFNFKK
jgi:DNA-binding GntR family transcriptional regulator